MTIRWSDNDRLVLWHDCPLDFGCRLLIAGRGSAGGPREVSLTAARRRRPGCVVPVDQFCCSTVPETVVGGCVHACMHRSDGFATMVPLIARL